MDMCHRVRLARYADVSTALALKGDRRLGQLVDAAQPLGHGIGGTSAALDVDGVPGLREAHSAHRLGARGHDRNT
jgi:hypothetical protein